MIDCIGKKESNHGWTPLHLSCYFGHYEIVKILLENKASVNVINDSGDTPLHKASYVGRLDIVNLAHDAAVFTKNAEGKTPKNIGKDNVLEALIVAEFNDTKRKEEQFLRAARDGDLSTVKELFNDLNPVVVHCEDSDGNTALHYASYGNHKEIVLYLLQNSTNSFIRNNSERFAASLASSAPKNLMLQELLSDGSTRIFEEKINNENCSLVSMAIDDSEATINKTVYDSKEMELTLLSVKRLPQYHQHLHKLCFPDHRCKNNLSQRLIYISLVHFAGEYRLTKG